MRVLFEPMHRQILADAELAQQQRTQPNAQPNKVQKPGVKAGRSPH
ncbi:hypothetical protein [Thermoleptolyngbya sp.]